MEGENVQNEEKELSERIERYKKREVKREEVRSDLLEQLQERNILEAYFTDLVGDYISFWDIKNELIYDIELKGVSVVYKNGANQYGYKRNDSVSELNRVNAQMLNILRELGLKPSATTVDDDNDFIL